MFEIRVSDAEDFFVALAMGLIATEVPVDPPVPVATTLEPVPVLVEFVS